MACTSSSSRRSSGWRWTALRLRKCACGAAWLTQEGDPDDAVLRGGAVRQLGGDSVLIEALEPARLQLVAETGRGRRLARRLRAAVRPLRRWVRRLQLGPGAELPV